MITPLWNGFAYKPHQTVGITWMQARETQLPCGGIVCDEMGLGKTIEMLGLIKCDKKTTHTLLIAPVAVLNQWADTAKKSKITVLRPSVTARHVAWEVDGIDRFKAPKLYIIGYEAARSKHELLTTFPWDRLICDEAHRIASGNSCFELVDLLVARARWLLSATPIVNGIEDLAHLFQILGVENPKHVVGNFETLEPVANKLILARSMDQLRESIPDAPPKYVVNTVKLPFHTEEEAEFYRGMSGVIVRRWKALDSDGAGALGKIQLFMKLRQLSLHPQVYIDARKKALGSNYDRPDWVGDSTKFEAICSKIGSQIGDGAHPHKWIVFCHFHPEMDLLKKMLEKQSWCRTVSIYSGALNHKTREEVLKATHVPLPDSSMTDVILIQLQSGGTGLNLQHFDRIIFTGPWWTRALMEQAIGRAVRIGQTQTVEIYNFVLMEEEGINIDSKMKACADEKGDLCKTILQMACRTSRALENEKEDSPMNKDVS